MASIQRTYTFEDGSDLVNSQVETEIGAVADTFNKFVQGSSSIVGNLTITGSGKGIVFTTPDGLRTYLLSVDNNGNMNWTELT